MNVAQQQNAFVLERTAFGKLILTNAQGERLLASCRCAPFPSWHLTKAFL